MSYIEELRDKKISLILFGLKERVLNTFSILGLAELLNIRTTKAEAKILADELSV